MNADKVKIERIGAGAGSTTPAGVRESISEDARGKDRQGIVVLSSLAALIASLCCLTPLVLVLLGLASLSTAVAMDDLLSGRYVWVFWLGALAFIAVALWVYFRRRGICTLDSARRQRNRILNTLLLTVLFGTAGYIALNYIVFAYLGAAAGLPWAIERWAFPAAVALFAAGVVLYRWLKRSS